MTTTSQRRLRLGLAIAALALACAGLAGARCHRTLAETRASREWTRSFAANWPGSVRPEQLRLVDRFSETDWNYLIGEAARPENRFEKWVYGHDPWAARARDWTGNQNVTRNLRPFALQTAWNAVRYHPEARRLALIDAATRAKGITVPTLLLIATHPQSVTPDMFARLRRLALSGPTQIRIAAAVAISRSGTGGEIETGNLLHALEKDPDAEVASAAKVLSGLFANRHDGATPAIPPDPFGGPLAPTVFELPTTLSKPAR